MSSLGIWGFRLLTLAIALMLSTLGSELLRWRGARRLDTLRAQHWTEQTRVLAEINSAVRMFRICLLSATIVSAAMANREARIAELMRFAAAATAIIVLLGDPLAGRWARRATAGGLAPVSWSDAQRLALVLFPSRIVLLGFAICLPPRYDVVGCC